MHRLITTRLQLLTVGLACLGIGAGAGAIATADASSAIAHTRHAQRGAPQFRARLRAVARRTVAGSFVLATPSGFVTVQLARGLVQAVNGQTVTLVEGTRTKTYRTVNLTLPAAVRVRDNRRASTLAHVTPGQRATVIMGPNRALLLAHTPRST